MTLKKIYGAILVIPLLGGIAARLLRVSIAFMLRDYGISIFDISLLSSTFMLTRGIISPIAGKFADRGYRRFYLIIIGLLGLALDSYLYLLIPYPYMLILRGLDGMYGAMVWPSMQAFVHFSSPREKRARLMSLYFIMGSVGMAVGYIIYNFLLGNVYLAIYTVITFQISAAIISLLFRNFEKEKSEKKREKKYEKLPVEIYTLTFLFGMFMGLGNEVILFYLAEVMFLGKYLSTGILFLAGIYALYGSYTMGFLADHLGLERAIVIVAAFGFVSCLFISINHLFFVILGAFLFFIGGRGFMPISRSYGASKTKKVGASLGYINMASNFGAVVSPLIGGAILDFFGKESYFIFNISGVSFLIIGSFLFLNAIILKEKRAFSE